MGVYLQQHGYGVMHVDVSGEHNNEMIEAEIDGKRVDFTVDTGCNLTSITARCARSLKLQVHASGLIAVAVEGVLKIGVAEVKSFKLNGYEINRTSTINVYPEGAWTGRGSDGLFGFDYMHANAVILPVGAHLFLFKPGATPVAPIDHYMALLGLRPIPVKYVKGGLRIEGELNGHPLVALVDCGAAYSSFDLAYVRANAGAPITGTDLVARGVDGHQIRDLAFVTKGLKLGPLDVPPTEMITIPTPVFKPLGFNVLLGYDFLAAHEAIIDLGSDTLWMK